MSNSRPPLPPFSLETAVQKVRQAEDAWNTRDPERVVLAYTEDRRAASETAEIFTNGPLLLPKSHGAQRLNARDCILRSGKWQS